MTDRDRRSPDEPSFDPAASTSAVPEPSGCAKAGSNVDAGSNDDTGVHNDTDTGAGDDDSGLPDDDASPAETDGGGESVQLTVESRAHGWRLDHYLSRLFPNHSRSQLQKSVEAGHVLLNGISTRSSRRLRVNDRLSVQLQDADTAHFQPEDIPLDILYEDDSLVVVNKPAGMVVHPGRGSYSGTLASALQFHFNRLSDVGGRHRPGIVHRLDRDTTGVILVAKDNRIHQKISHQFERRETQKEYLAIVRGIPELESDFIRTHMCVHYRIRERMMVCAPTERSREAVTFYRTAEKFAGFALMELHPKTGRTHQLRVHMLHIGTPIVADRLYTGETRVTQRTLQPDSATDDILIERQALHAHRLTIIHPVTQQPITFEAPLPPDFQTTLQALRSMQKP
ncbi:MAG: RluA family pseudouridine synthase [Planctomycetaceae bacterium]|nr:RluA family pseudouridine synthase [Planctomycetaceae bacterium]